MKTHDKNILIPILWVYFQSQVRRALANSDAMFWRFCSLRYSPLWRNQYCQTTLARLDNCCFRHPFHRIQGIKKVLPFDRTFLMTDVGYTPERLELILLNTLPIIGPRIMRAAITTIATKTRIRAYSTRPWPFSLGENNIVFYLLSFGFLRKVSQDSYIVHGLEN